MELDDYQIKFIEENIEMIDNYKYQEFFDKMCSGVYAPSNILEFLYVECNINLLQYLSNIGSRSRALRGCKWLKEINTNLDHIPVGAFAGCTGAKSAVIQQAVEIPAFAFENCSSLETVTIGEGVKAIRKDAFVGCRNIKKIELPSTIEVIEGSAFDCASLPEDLKVLMTKDSLKNIKMRNDFAKLLMKEPKGRGRLELK